MVRTVAFHRVRVRPGRDMLVEFVGSLLSQLLVFGKRGDPGKKPLGSESVKRVFPSGFSSPIKNQKLICFVVI